MWNSSLRKLTYFVPEPDTISAFQIPLKYKYRNIYSTEDSRKCLLPKWFNYNTPMDMTIGIAYTTRFQQKYFSGDFPQLLEQSLLRTYIDGCFQNVRLQNICKVFRKNQCDEVLLKWSCPKNVKNIYFPKRFVKGLLLFFHKNIERSELVWGKGFKNSLRVPKFLVRSQDSDLNFNMAIK